MAIIVFTSLELLAAFLRYIYFIFDDLSGISLQHLNMYRLITD